MWATKLLQFKQYWGYKKKQKLYSNEEQDISFEKGKNVMIGYSLPQEYHLLSIKSAALDPHMVTVCVALFTLFFSAPPWFPQISGLEWLNRRVKKICWSQAGMLQKNWVVSTLKEKQKLTSRKVSMKSQETKKSSEEQF